jgi:hypothetical protein
MLADEGMIDRECVEVMSYVPNAEAAWQALVDGGLPIPERPGSAIGGD